MPASWREFHIVAGRDHKAQMPDLRDGKVEILKSPGEGFKTRQAKESTIIREFCN